jgi:hypothetical protein
MQFWFRPADRIGLHVVRVAAGLVFLAWLLPLAGDAEAVFGLTGWFDDQAYREAGRIVGGPPQPITWSIVYLFGSNAGLLTAFYWLSIVVLVLFTAGLWTRLTSLLTWVIVASFTASPAFGSDADSLLLLLSLYLMVGYVLLGLTDRDQPLHSRLLGEVPGTFSGPAQEKVPGTFSRPSIAVNVALRLLQVHVAIVMVASGLHKLQFGDWWAGFALWYPLHPVMEMSEKTTGAAAGDGSSLVLGLAAYAVLAWQIAFPAFAWKPRWRPVLLGGALIGGLGCAFLYRVPTFGPALFAACLAYVSAREWRRLFGVMAWVPGLGRRGDKATRRQGDEEAEPAATISGAGKRQPGQPSPGAKQNTGIRLCLLGSLSPCLLVCASCAPVDSIDEKKESTDTGTPSVEERVALASPPSALRGGSSVIAGDDTVLKGRIETVIDQVRQRELLLNNGFWTVFHGILGLGPSVKLKHPLLGIQVNAVDYICSGGELRGLRFLPTEYGVDVESGETFVSQGHQDQFVAEMAQCGLPADKEFTIHGKKYRFMDFVRHSQMRARVNDRQELSWTIIVVGQYLGTNIAWTNSFGEKLRFEDLVRYEVDANVEQAPCGGTHRLFGLQWACNLHLRNGGRIEGVWKDLMDEQVRYQRLARDYQNSDGSFSTEFFRNRGNSRDMQLGMNTTGHILEWLAYSLPESELRKEWMERAVNRLSLMFLDIQNRSMESGTLYHAAHGLRIYYERVFGDGLSVQKPFLVLAPKETTQTYTPAH